MMIIDLRIPTKTSLLVSLHIHQLPTPPDDASLAPLLRPYSKPPTHPLKQTKHDLQKRL